jgi:hypothetical protein
VPCTPWPCFRTTIPACAGLPPRLRVEAPHAFTWSGDDEETIACVAETPPATNRLRCSRARGLRHRDPVPAPLHPPSLSLRRAGELDPLAPCLRAGRGPNAARRLLQYKQSASTTCESTDPHVTEHPELTLARSARLTCFRPRGPEPPPDPRLAPGIWLRHREAPKALLDRDLRLVVEACASSSAADGFCLALPSNITRDLATPNVAIGECAACANRGLTGQGPMASAVSMSLSGPPAACRPKACSRRSFAPTRSARTPPVVESLQG